MVAVARCGGAEGACPSLSVHHTSAGSQPDLQGPHAHSIFGPRRQCLLAVAVGCQAARFRILKTSCHFWPCLLHCCQRAVPFAAWRPHARVFNLEGASGGRGMSATAVPSTTRL